MDPAGEHPIAVAEAHPDRLAVVMSDGSAQLTYGELVDRSARLAQVFHDAGLRPGDHLAVLLDTRLEFFEAVWAGMRSGLYVTPVNWHLNADEAAFIAADCGAKALISAATSSEVAEGAVAQLDDLDIALSVGGAIAGFDSYEDTLTSATLSDTDPPAECAGQWMFYSSGTTGRPKGIVPGPVGAELGKPQGFTMLLTGMFGMSPESVYLSPAPLYHAAPAGWTTAALALGCTVVVMPSFNPEKLLAAVEEFSVTHLQVVPTHFVRMLKLPEEARSRYDTSSLQAVVHAAAPCPISIKSQMMDWLGPVIYEYYAGSEGNGFCAIGPEEWLAHPGSVGKSLLGEVHVVDGTGNELGPDEDGEIWFSSPRRFEYHGDPDKTAAVWDDERGWSTIGDVGHVDDEGYVYLTDRASNMIISGGVNIYPREIEDLLIGRDEILDVAVIGTPDDEMGERVTAFVQLDPRADANPDTIGAELIGYCRDHLAHYKCPREVRVVDELPRLPTGKLLKRLLT